ncbi:tRNA modification GTPase MnmE [Flavobacteriaceae bacterium UJ101]|nr:tRNA modification GTPase MnmE [Flavobacteriaceae bacterium UJ101]
MIHFEDTIVALATPNGAGAIAVIRLSGKQALEIAHSVFESIHEGKQLIHQKSHTIHLGYVKDDVKNIDQALFSIFKGPHSYTGENVVEISCHGSVYIQQQILQLLIKKGARIADPGEYTLRAFLNGKMDLSQAEAVADLISANSEIAHQTALQQMKGGFSNELGELRKKLIHFASMLELELDFATEDVEFADRSELNRLLEKLEYNLKYLADSFSLGNVIKEGIPVAIVGEPNTGKSTLLNTLLNEERAIVSNIEGTTRDTIEDELVLEGINYRFIDTAGIRDTQDQIENIGIQKTFEKIEASKVVLYMVDVEKIQHDPQKIDRYLEEIHKITSQYPTKKVLVLLNKVDLIPSELDLTAFNTLENCIPISAKEKKGIKTLTDELVNVIKRGEINTNQTIVTNTRHYEALVSALEAIQKTKQGLEMEIPGDLLALDVRQALHHLGEITGEIDVDTDILGTIFGEFCIGK